MLSSVTKTLLVGAVAVAGQGWLGPVGKTGRSSGCWAFVQKVIPQKDISEMDTSGQLI